MRLFRRYGALESLRKNTMKSHNRLRVKLTSYSPEEIYLLGYNAVYSGKSQLAFRRNISPLSSASNSKPRNTHGEWEARRSLFTV
jgi:hypothetical protein